MDKQRVEPQVDLSAFGCFDHTYSIGERSALFAVQGNVSTFFFFKFFSEDSILHVATHETGHCLIKKLRFAVG